MSLFIYAKTAIKKLVESVELNVIDMRRKDVFMRKRGMRIGQGCSLITSVGNFGTEPYLIRIGNRVTITDGVKFITHDASTRLFRAEDADMNAHYGNLFGIIIIGDNCFIGMNTILLPNTLIGSNCVIGAGAVVKGTFPDNSLIVGVPARRVSSLEDYIEKVKGKMIPVKAQTRNELRRELTAYFFGESS